ncbi:hypothetical protein [Streptomyces lasiicapitis]|uniref:hypothetical protein n=1 Tax=Streptomyces lasiicapitis TaxID=1923961 RepID=UPI00365B91B7
MRLGRAVATGIAEESAAEFPAGVQLPVVEDTYRELIVDAEESAAPAPVEVTAGR